VSESFDLETPDHFTTGAIGPPGQRVFYLQAREGGLVVTLKAEKEQVNALADYLAGLLEKLANAPSPASGTEALLEPVDPAWTVGSLGVGFEQDKNRVVIVAHELVESDDDEEEGDEESEEPEREATESAESAGEEAAAARFHITPVQAASFVERARALVRAGRPICPMCSQPKDPAGHVCPRSNGHVVH
jgi:uncharacterized repeat protein (TIGR03847 family)